MKTSEAVVALEALAQESRLGIFRLLVVAGPSGLAAGQIAERMKLPAPTLSFHLAQLRNAGLVSCLRDGRSLIYSANFAEMNGLVAFLTDHCCGTAGMCAPACGATQTIRKEKRK
jgi:ArsR family transcriptional regulator, arsenate/arsenite/antimonite-responsive transcriptional repressor